MNDKELTSAEINDLSSQQTVKKSNDEWTDFIEMYDDIREYAKNNGRQIISADRPTQLKFGWQCEATGKTWAIRITDLRKSLEKYRKDNPNDPLIRAFSSSDGKANLTSVLNGKP